MNASDSRFFCDRKLYGDAELRSCKYSVTVDSRLVVGDVNLNRHPVLNGFGQGPCTALGEARAGNSDFVRDACPCC